MIMWILLALVAFVWLVFGASQDIRTREVANWLTFSLITIGIAARLLFSVAAGDAGILLLGATSLAVMTLVAFIFYYGRVFAGGDAKLLIGIGMLIPSSTHTEAIFNSIISVVALLMVGFVWSIIYSIKISLERRKEFSANFMKVRKHYLYLLPLAVIVLVMSMWTDLTGMVLFLVLDIALLSYPYLKAVDKTLMRLYNPSELTEGDWLLNDVRMNGMTIRASVHGLSRKEINMIMNAKKKVMIKEGIPFVPAFLLAFILMALFFAFEGVSFFLELFQAVF